MENSEMENADLLQPTDDLDPELEDEETESEDTQPNLDVRHKDLPFVVNGVRVYGKRNPASVIEARCQRLYRRQLEGLTIRQLVLDHMTREGIAEATAWRDWNQVSKWNDDDWNIERSTILPRIQQMRLKIINAAIKKGQLQTAVMCLKDLGNVIGEVAPENVAMLAPVLNITVEESRPKNFSSGAEPINITPEIVEEPEKLSIEVDDI
jgi:hypothetical protein